MPDEPATILPCPHGRPSWHSCPHCLGINQGSAEAQPSTSVPVDPLGRLAAIAADLDGYIDRRATELAAERIEAADDAASDRVAAVVGDLQRRLSECAAARERAEDLVAELRRRIFPLERQAQSASTARDRLAAAMGLAPAGCDLQAIVRDAEKGLAYLREPAVSESERWQIEEARDMLAGWQRDRGDAAGYDRERTIADHVKHLLAIVDQVAPKGGARG